MATVQDRVRNISQTIREHPELLSEFPELRYVRQVMGWILYSSRIWPDHTLSDEDWLRTFLKNRQVTDLDETSTDGTVQFRDNSSFRK